MDANCEYDEDRLRCLDRKDSDCAVDVAAPSVNLAVFSSPSAILTGTSFASPITAALCSTILDLDMYPSLTAAEVRNIVRTRALPVDPVQRDPNRPNQFARCGAGKIQWNAALKAAKELIDARAASQQTDQ